LIQYQLWGCHSLTEIFVSRFAKCVTFAKVLTFEIRE
jgi:hypothetical protein